MGFWRRSAASGCRDALGGVSLSNLDFEDGIEIFQHLSGKRTRRAAAAHEFKPRYPAIVLIDPKYPHNVGQAMRLCSCYAVEHLIISGERVPLDPKDGYRLPREERMRGYADVTLMRAKRPLDLFPRGAAIVGIEVRTNAEDLVHFAHPHEAVYVFGPEDGGLDKAVLARCSRFVRIPTLHCLNLATAVGTVLYDRMAKGG
jgi:tRNA(Leu) C34 or U34 (ribose-2'-O)-methylase TrmL